MQTLLGHVGECKLLPRAVDCQGVKLDQVFGDTLAVFHPEVDQFAFNVTGFVIGAEVGFQFFNKSIPVFKPRWRFLG